METAERLLALLSLLQRRPDWSAEELADRLGVTTRTVRRDVARLRTYGYPIDAFAGHGGGYQLAAGASLPPLAFDADEAVAVALGLRLCAHVGLDDIDEPAHAALAKIEQLLPVRWRARLDDLSAVTVIDSPTTNPATRQHFELFTRAAATRQVVEFMYVDQHGVESTRRAEPVQLVFVGRRWYLAAFDLDRHDWRTFRIDRVLRATADDRRFRPRPGPDPSDLVRGSAPPEACAHQAVVQLDCDASDARVRIPASIGAITPDAGGTVPRCRLVVGTDDLDWLARFLLQLPWPFEVEEPSALRTRVRTLARQVAARHR